MEVALPDISNLNKGVAQKFHELFPASDLFLLPTARHFVQMDEPSLYADDVKHPDLNFDNNRSQ